MWSRLDDGWWKNRKLRARTDRASRGLFADFISFCGDQKSDGWLPLTSLPQLECAPNDPDLKTLIRGGLLHKKGDQCACIEKRRFVFPDRERGYLIHDFFDYNPSKSENEVTRAQTAELRDPALRQAVRERDFGRCRYCAIVTVPTDRRGPTGETLDHVDPLIAAGRDNLVIACRACNSAKKKRTPEQALMVLLDVADVRAKHYADLGVTDPDLAHDSKPIQVAQAHGPGRVGSGRVGSGLVALPHQIGPPTTIRDSQHPNPYVKAAHGDPTLDPPPPEPVSAPARASPPTPRHQTSSSRQPRKRKGKR